MRQLKSGQNRAPTVKTRSPIREFDLDTIDSLFVR